MGYSFLRYIIRVLTSNFCSHSFYVRLNSTQKIVYSQLQKYTKFSVYIGILLSLNTLIFVQFQDIMSK